jgi:hypothetical protein
MLSAVVALPSLVLLAWLQRDGHFAALAKQEERLGDLD